MIVVKTWRQLIGIEVTQSFDAIITTTKVEMIVAPNMNVVKRRIVIRLQQIWVVNQVNSQQERI
jgi:hypothetical protein